MRLAAMILTVLMLVLGAACPRPRPKGLNDPRDAVSFFCTESESDPNKNACLVTEAECSGLVDAEKRKGVFMSPCSGYNEAWCAFSEMPEGPDLWSCARTVEDCVVRRAEDRRVHRARPGGECVAFVAGSKARKR